MAAKRNGRGGARVGAGRKPKPPAEKQRRPVTVKFTDAEYRELSDVADTEPLAGFIRRLVLRYLARRRR